MRTVTASGWPYEYRAFVTPSKSFWRYTDGYRYVVEKKWVHWGEHKVSKWYATKDEALAAADKWLDQHDGDREYIE